MERFTKNSYLAQFLAQAWKNKKPSLKKTSFISWIGNPKKASYISGNETFQSTPITGNGNPEKILAFSQKKAILLFQETETRKNSLELEAYSEA